MINMALTKFLIMEIQEIKKLIENYLKIDLKQKSRKQEFVFGRYAYYYLCYKYANGFVTDEKLGSSLGFDRCSVIYGMKELPNIINHDVYKYSIFKDIEKKVSKKSTPIEKKFDEPVTSEVVKLQRMLYNVLKTPLKERP